jgi:hypothetical protein
MPDSKELVLVFCFLVAAYIFIRIFQVWPLELW